MKFPLAALLALVILPVAACASSQYQHRFEAPVPAADGMASFHEKDADRDGALAPRELAAGLAVSASEAVALFEALDRDGDERLTPAEYFPDPRAVRIVTRHEARQADRSR